MKVILRLFFFSCLLIAARAGAQSTLPARPVPGIQHVLIIIVDGLRPDLALRGETPAIHQMLKDGSFTMWANTTAESVTLPSCTSMLTGVIPIRHKLLWDMDLPLTQPVYPAFPTIFELAHGAGYTTAMTAGKNKFINITPPGSLDWSYIPTESKCEDAAVMTAAIAILCDHRPDVMCVHLPSVDNAGHALGWASEGQMAAIARMDVNVGLLMSTLSELGRRDSTMVILTADHGGAGLIHGPDDSRSRYIPWIVTGAGIRRGLDLTTFSTVTVNTEDTFATACYVLGIHPHKLPLDGKPVMEIFDHAGQELIRDQ